jgi:benzylsuccinate CoA-transferase BbsF subunit
MLDFEMNGTVQQRNGNRTPLRAPQGAYPCAGTDQWLAISIATHEQFRALVAELGLPVDADAYATLDARQADHDALDELIATATRGRDAHELEVRLQHAGVEATHIADPRDVWLDPQLAARGFGEIVAAPPYAPELGPRVFPRAAWRMSCSRAETRRPAPAFGEHTSEVLTECLGLTRAELDGLAADGVIADRPHDGLVPGRPLDLEGLLAADRLSTIDHDFQRRLLHQFSGDNAVPPPPRSR